MKIAILDTGVVEDLKERVSDYRDFASRNDADLQDPIGHGTQAVFLIDRIYPEAELYVGRIYDGRHATDDAAALVTEVNILKQLSLYQHANFVGNLVREE